MGRLHIYRLSRGPLRKVDVAKDPLWQQSLIVLIDLVGARSGKWMLLRARFSSSFFWNGPSSHLQLQLGPLRNADVAKGPLWQQSYRLDRFSRVSLRQMGVSEGPIWQQFLSEWAVFTSTASVEALSVR